MANLEQTLSGWTGPSSNSEQEKQDRTERMIREAIAEHSALSGVRLRVFAKGSYANNTNVRTDSDVDIAVQCTEAEYWEEAQPGLRPSNTGGVYGGKWTPSLLRSELTAALIAKFGTAAVDTSNSTAIFVKSSSARVDADVVPCFSFRRYMPGGDDRLGTMIFKQSGERIINYPDQQLKEGRAKNTSTGNAYKKSVRILKRLENVLVAESRYKELASYFVECLAYNCPEPAFAHSTWTETVKAMLIAIWNNTQGDEPADESLRWLEVNRCFFLFHPKQKWTRADAQGFAQAAWTYLRF
ncbi:MAG: nucleotidyltransferase [Cyanobium sp.]|nr:MAG: nucleotidyltransferase [Cyanobium sp.]